MTRQVVEQLVKTIFVTNNHTLPLVAKEIFVKISKSSIILLPQLQGSEMSLMGHGVRFFNKKYTILVRFFLSKNKMVLCQKFKLK